MTYLEVREVLAESGKTTVSEMIKYLKTRYSGKYDVKSAKVEAKELVSEMKSYM